MEGEEKHREDVKGRDQRIGKTNDHHREDVVMIERIKRKRVKARVGGADREMQDVIDDKGEKDYPAPDHGTGGKGGFDSVLAFVMLGPGPAVFDRELDRVINVEDDDEEQNAADDPEEGPKLPEIFGVAVDPLRSEENLEIAKEVADDEQNQDHPGHRHDYFSANGGAMKSGDGGHRKRRGVRGRIYRMRGSESVKR